MKNVHVLPTDKPSKLCSVIVYTGELEFILFEDAFNKTSRIYPQHVYITDDSEIKTKDYILIIRDNLLIGKLWEIVLINSTREYRTEYTRLDGTKGWFASDVNYQKDWNYKKIILTTDTDLITEGVQAIDDEFLKWFVKNPSCESVEVYEVGDKLFAEPVIPKEEPKQETLEEAAENNYPIGDDWTEIEALIRRLAFKNGVKWQAEKMYSEEEVLDILNKLHKSPHALMDVSLKEWFEQFKK